jgi:hypothetical protein
MSVALFFEKVAAFACGAIITAAITWLLKSKPKYVCFVLLNSLSGALLRLVLSAFLPIKTAVLSWFICGVFGIISFAFAF